MSSPPRLPLPLGPCLVSNTVRESPNSCDNTDGELIVYQGSQVTNPYGVTYTLVDKVGEGHFGNVYEVNRNSENDNNQSFAMKISKAEQNSIDQFNYETLVMQYINQNARDNNQYYIPYMHDNFMYNGHFCIILDLGGPNLYNVLTARNYEGLSLANIQTIARDLLMALVAIHRIGVIHTDIKPENIVQTNPYSVHVKLIDFGNSITLNNAYEQYFQTRYYRAPETVLQLNIDTKIDIWSLGCVLCELFLGLPILPAINEFHLVSLIEQTIGPFPTNMVEQSVRRNAMFDTDFTVKSAQTISQEEPEMSFESFEPYFVYTQLRDILENYPVDSSFNEERERIEIQRRDQFINLVIQMLKIDPDDRLSAEEALLHPFMSLHFD